METSKTKNGKSKTTYISFSSYISENEKVFSHFSPQATELRRMYPRSIQIIEKIIDKDSFAEIFQ